jgi:hypothetical protein
MTAIVWDESTKHLFETGVDHAVLYPMRAQDGLYPLGYAWNGITGITESPSGADASPLYADNIKYLNLIAAESFGGTIEAFTYPDVFALCDGSVEPTPGLVFGQQSRSPFGLAYRTVVGNDAEGNAYGYKLHLIYGAVAAPSEKDFQTINDSPAAITFSWAINTTPVTVTTYKPVSSIVIDSTRVDPTKLAALEAILFGTVGADPRLPLPDEVYSVLSAAAPSALTMTSSPVDDSSGAAITANIVLTFNNKILKESIVVASAAGVIKAVDRSWDTAGKVLTLDPTTNLAGGTVYLVSVVGVVDIYGQSLAPAVVNFQTT